MSWRWPFNAKWRVVRMNVATSTEWVAADCETPELAYATATYLRLQGVQRVRVVKVVRKAAARLAGE
jgi:hypothetical protein